MKKIKLQSSRNTYSVQAVENALGIMETLGEAAYEQSIQELQSVLGLTKRTVEKLLKTLGLFGYVESNRNTGNYSLGVKAFQTGKTFIDNFTIQYNALPVLKNLTKKTGESAYLAVMPANDVIYIHSCETGNPVRPISPLWDIYPAANNVSGRALTAFRRFSQPENQTLEYINTELNTNDKLEKIFTKGFDEETDTTNDLYKAAAPVFNFENFAVAALEIISPKHRADENRIQNELIPELLFSANELSGRFGYKPEIS